MPSSPYRPPIRSCRWYCLNECLARSPRSLAYHLTLTARNREHGGIKTSDQHDVGQEETAPCAYACPWTLMDSHGLPADPSSKQSKWWKLPPFSPPGRVHHCGIRAADRGRRVVVGGAAGAVFSAADRTILAGPDLKAENGRKNVKSAPYRPILSEDMRRQRPTPVYADADPAQTGQNGENWDGK